MASFSATPIASTYHQVKVGGDAAALKGIMKAIIARCPEPDADVWTPELCPYPVQGSGSKANLGRLGSVGA